MVLKVAASASAQPASTKSVQRPTSLGVVRRPISPGTLRRVDSTAKTTEAPRPISPGLVRRPSAPSAAAPTSARRVGSSTNVSAAASAPRSTSPGQVRRPSAASTGRRLSQGEIARPVSPGAVRRPSSAGRVRRDEPEPVNVTTAISFDTWKTSQVQGVVGVARQRLSSKDDGVKAVESDSDNEADADGRVRFNKPSGDSITPARTSMAGRYNVRSLDDDAVTTTPAAAKTAGTKTPTSKPVIPRGTPSRTPVSVRSATTTPRSLARVPSTQKAVPSSAPRPAPVDRSDGLRGTKYMQQLYEEGLRARRRKESLAQIELEKRRVETEMREAASLRARPRINSVYKMRTQRFRTLLTAGERLHYQSNDVRYQRLLAQRATERILGYMLMRKAQREYKAKLAAARLLTRVAKGHLARKRYYGSIKPHIHNIHVEGLALEGEQLHIAGEPRNCTWDDCIIQWKLVNDPRGPVSGDALKVSKALIGKQVRCIVICKTASGLEMLPKVIECGTVVAAPPSISDLNITPATGGTNTSLFTVSGTYFGGKEGKSVVTWYRDKGSQRSKIASGVMLTQYQAVFADANSALVVEYTPIRDDGVVGASGIVACHVTLDPAARASMKQ